MREIRTTHDVEREEKSLAAKRNRPPNESTPDPDEASGVAAAGRKKTVEPPDGYKERLIKYIPGEIIALYLTYLKIVETVNKPGVSADANPDSIPGWVAYAAFFFCLVMTPIYQRFYLNIKKVSQLIVATFSFVVWALTLGGGIFQGVPAWVGAMLLPTYTFLIALFEPPPQPGK
jgi:hypothetical protein